MNYRMIFYILGWMLNIEAALMLAVGGITALVYGEKSGMSFVIVAAAMIFIGFLLTVRKPKNNTFYAKEGFVIVSLGWILISIAGAMPFYVSGEIPRFIDALFETISGFTTTGASILSDVDSMSRCLVMWRSFTHWVGGMGVLVFMLAIIPMVGGGRTIHLLRAESPGPIVGKLLPRLKESASVLYIIYLVMTLLEMVILLLTKMPTFDAIALSFGTAGTGGFTIRNSGMADYTMLQQAIITLFMILFGVNFNAYFFLVMRKPKEILKCEEVRWYFIIIAVSTGLIAINVHSMFESLLETLHHSSFQVASLITTTGYSTVDFDGWPLFSKCILLMLMFVGACAGSTGGGIKVSRFIIPIKAASEELFKLVHPRTVRVFKLDGKKVEQETVRNVNIYLFIYVLIFGASMLVMCLDPLFASNDFLGPFSTVTTALNNIGPGMGVVGPTDNFGKLTDLSKLVMMFDMLTGRLEIFPMLLLFVPATWKKL